MFNNTMRRATILALVLVFALCSTAYAANSSDLLNVLPGEPGDTLTRSEFGAMLVKAANLQPADRAVTLPGDVKAEAWYAGSMQTLLSTGILRGFDDNTVKPDQPISQPEAVAMVARALGLPLKMSARNTDQLSIPVNHWAFNDYGWMINEGLLPQVDTKKVLTPEEGADLLAHVFGTAEKCREITDKMETANQSITSTRMSGEMDMQMNMRQIGDTQDMPSSVSTTVYMDVELVMDQGLHMVMETSISAGENLPAESITMEQYMTHDGMFMSIQDPETKEITWTKVPGEAFPNIMELLKQQTNPLPEELKNMFHYRYLGEEKLAGQEVYKLAYYGEIKDLAKMIAALGQLGGGQLQQTMEQSQGMLQSISYVGTMYVDKETYLPVSASNYSIVTYAGEFQGQPVPIDTMRVCYEFSYSDYNAPMDIVVPQEALAAEELPLTAPEIESTETVQPAAEQ